MRHVPFGSDVPRLLAIRCFIPVGSVGAYEGALDSPSIVVPLSRLPIGRAHDYTATGKSLAAVLPAEQAPQLQHMGGQAPARRLTTFNLTSEYV